MLLLAGASFGPAVPRGLDQSSDGLVCLMYHRFVDAERFQQLSRADSCYCISTERFEAQLQWLRENGYRSVRLDEALAYAQGRGSLPSRSVLITIDDGCRSVTELTGPMLKKYGYQAVVFVTTDPSAKVFHDVAAADPQMTPEEIRSLDPAVFEVGAHGVMHRRLTELSDSELMRELAESRRTLEQWTRRPVRTLAAPHGRYDARVQRVARAVGYEAMFTSDRGVIEPTRDIFALPRQSIAGYWSAGKFGQVMGF